MKKTILYLACLFVTGCTSTLPAKVSVSPDYNLQNVKTASINLECKNVKIDNLDIESLPDFCQMLLSSVKINVRSRAELKVEENNSDIGINVKLEEIYGGNPHVRLWVGLGAGKTALTTLTTITRNGKEVAQMRNIETSTTPNVVVGTFTNESFIFQDIGIVGKKIADFILNPNDFIEKPAIQ